MMKQLFISLFLFLSLSVQGQPLPVDFGGDGLPRLNEKESAYFNQLSMSGSAGFDFTGIQVAFIEGSAGNKFTPKDMFFRDHILPYKDEGLAPRLTLVRLTLAEKVLTGGYDAFILGGVKAPFTTKLREKMIKKLSVSSGSSSTTVAE